MLLEMKNFLDKAQDYAKYAVLCKGEFIKFHTFLCRHVDFNSPDRPTEGEIQDFLELGENQTMQLAGQTIVKCEVNSLNYYEDQMNQITLGEYPSQVKLRGNGTDTKWLSLNKTSAALLVTWLTDTYKL